MSAFVVSAGTIDAIVSGARQYGGQTGFSLVRLFPGTQPEAGYSHHRFSRYASEDEAPETYNPDTLGRELWTENLRSIHHRYPDTVDGENLPGPIGFTEAEAIAYTYGPGSRVADVDPLGVLGAIRGYRYQTCEHPEWPHSIAYAACEAIEAQIIGWMIDQAGANTWAPDDADELAGDTIATPTEAGGWMIEFRPGRSAAVSLTERMVRGR